MATGGGVLSYGYATQPLFVLIECMVMSFSASQRLIPHPISKSNWSTFVVMVQASYRLGNAPCKASHPADVAGSLDIQNRCGTFGGSLTRTLRVYSLVSPGCM